eukprot:TRINITY_DN64431_c0_g1_i1.p1 TRINITY_DN64431_c0_g1~~TRINITY_DN64431_c0_g1_i1.p1  ORF type:complete len:234 (-),score=39.71 TRINITY_DN64431_c0_g1_i1:209-910(-)
MPGPPSRPGTGSTDLLSPSARLGSLSPSASELQSPLARPATGLSAAEPLSPSSRPATLAECEATGPVVEDHQSWEYTDLGASIQLHAWGTSLEQALGALGESLFGCMTDVQCVDVDKSKNRCFEVFGHDLPALVHGLLDQLLYRFAAEGIVCREVLVERIVRIAAIPNEDDDGEFARADLKPSYTAHVRSKGEAFNLGKHTQGPGIKAVTYKGMHIHEGADGRTDLRAIVDTL